MAYASTGSSALVPNFIDQALLNLKTSYPNWKNCDINERTICIPAYHASVRKYLGPSSSEASGYNINHEPDFRGGEAEHKFFSTMQDLEIGGILIANFDKMDFMKKIPESTKTRLLSIITDHAGDVNYKNASNQYECDFLFLHPRLGIHIIEVKAVEDLKNYGINHKVYQKAKKQAGELPFKIRLLWEAFTDGKILNIPIHSSICFPYCDLPPPAQDVLYDHIDTRLINSSQKFRQFWVNKFENSNFFTDSAFQVFIGAIAGCRSAVYLNVFTNAVQVAQMIDQQHINKLTKGKKKGLNPLQRKMWSEAADNFGSIIFLTPEQLRVADCTDPLQTITGPPGTGKTLILLLQALNSALKANASGDLRVFSHPSYIPKLESFFEAHSSNTIASGRRIYFDLDVKSEDDDWFIDEMAPVKEFMDLLEWRSKCKGKTVCIITGNANAVNIKRIQDEVSKYGTFIHHKLNTVMRGSVNIVDHWRPQLPNFNFVTGHSIRCADVENFKYSLMFRLTEKITELCKSFINARVSPKNMAIITMYSLEADIIRNGLNILSEGAFQCGSVVDQVKNATIPLVAVDFYDNVCSYEWTYVIVCSLICSDLDESFMLIASSRAIGHLYIVSRDYLRIQSQIDRQLDRTTTDLTGLDWTREATKLALDAIQLEDKITAPESYTLDIMDLYLEFHRTITILRNNFIVPNQRAHCRNCECDTLTDCLNMIARDSSLLLELVRNEIFKSNIELKLDIMHYSKLFEHVLGLDPSSAHARELLEFVKEWVTVYNSSINENKAIYPSSVFENYFDKFLWDAIVRTAAGLVNWTTILALG